MNILESLKEFLKLKERSDYYETVSNLLAFVRGYNPKMTIEDAFNFVEKAMEGVEK